MRFFGYQGDSISSYYRTDNVILDMLQIGKGMGSRIIIIGSDNLMNVNSDGIVTKADTADMSIPKYVQKFNENDTIYYFYFTFECKTLDEAAKDLAKFIVRNELGKDIWLFGHSKCGVCFYKSIEYIGNNFMRSKIKLVTVSAPFRGTIMVTNRFRKIPKRLKILINLMHYLFLSEHAIDNDISPRSEFLMKLPTEEEVLQVCTHYNICSTLVGTDFFKCKGVQDKFCKILEWAVGIDDGIVRFDSQYIYPVKYLATGRFAQGTVLCGHTSSLGLGIDLVLSGKLDSQLEASS